MSQQSGNLMDGQPGFYGWKSDPAEVARVLATMPFPHFKSAAAGLEGTGEDRTVLLWDAAIKVTGAHLPAQQQPRGTCVSRGWSRAVDYLSCVEIALLGEGEEYKSISHAVVYGMAKEVGGDLGPQNNYRDRQGNYIGDGAVGAWAAKAVTTMGCIDNATAGDVEAGSDELAIQFAIHGVPSDLKQKASGHPVGTASLLGSAEEARDAICNGYPVIVCSDQGFTMERDSEGRCRPSGTWNHCMKWSAWDHQRRRFCVEQSWGQGTPSGPIYLNQPTNSFWIDSDVGDRMIRQRDSYAISKWAGFVGRLLGWNI